MNWIECAALDLITVESVHRVTSAALLICTVHTLISKKFVDRISMTVELRISLLQAISMSVINGEEELKYLYDMMETPETKLVF